MTQPLTTSLDRFCPLAPASENRGPRVVQLILVLATVATFTAPPLAQSAEPSASLEFLYRDYDSRETDDGVLLNREQGQLKGVAFTVASDGWGGRWALHAGNEGGSLIYQGVTQVGIPLLTITDLNVQRVSVRWTPPWRPTIGPAMLQGHAEVAQQTIERAIRRSPLSLPLTENLNALWMRGGVELKLPVFANWSIHVDSQIAWPIHQRLRVNSFGVYDIFSLTPHARASSHLGAGITWQPSSHLAFDVRASHDRWHFGAGHTRPIFRDGEVAGSADYPGSRQRLTGFELELKHSF